MKRSEMLDILVQEFGRYHAPGSREDHERLAEHILSTVELFDMEPPNVCRDIGGYYDSEKHAAHFYMNKDLNYWEPEDE